MTNLVASFQGDGATPAARMSNPNPNGPIIPPGSSLGLLNDVGYGGYGPIRDISNKAPYEQSWSFGVQHETRWNLVLDASYIGKEGTHLYFANAGGINHLGREIEHYTNVQLTDCMLCQQCVRGSDAIERFADHYRSQQPASLLADPETATVDAAPAVLWILG